MSEARSESACRATGPSAIEQAIRELRPSDWVRLRRAGQILAWKVACMDGEAIMFEALERTLNGKRRWNRDAVDFVGHLLGVMRSVASHEAERQRLELVALTSRTVLMAPADQENVLSAAQQINRLRTHFAEHDDTLALQVLDALEVGYEGSAIREQLGLDQTRLESVVRRIRRVAARMLSA